MHQLLQWKTMDVTQTECVFVALGIQHTMRMRHIIICDLPCSKTFYHISHNQHDFRGGWGVIKQETFLFFYFHYNFCLKHFKFQEELSEND